MSTTSLTEDLAKTLFPKSRRAILGLLYSHPDEAYYLRQIVDLTGLAVGQVQRELNLLAGAGILTRTRQGRHIYFKVDDKCPVYSELRGIVRKTMGAGTVIGKALEKLSDRIRSAFIYGSVARAEEGRTSDIDVMVVGDATFAEVADAVRSAEHSIGREVNVTVYPVDELAVKVHAGHHFLKQVLSSDKLFLIGDEHELTALLEQSVDS
jgi:predicted nucleotidyltransferase